MRNQSHSRAAADALIGLFAVLLLMPNSASAQDDLVRQCTQLTAQECFKLHEKESDAIREAYNAQQMGVIGRGAVRPDPVKGQFDLWQDNLDGKFYSVWAGYFFPDPRDGSLYVGLETDVSGKAYPPPVKAGPLSIISVIDGIVQLRTRAGTFAVYSGDGEAHPSVRIDHVTYFTFDLRTLKYVKR